MCRAQGQQALQQQTSCMRWQQLQQQQQLQLQEVQLRPQQQQLQQQQLQHARPFTGDEQQLLLPKSRYID
ncbi:hypothetical protein ETH_00037105 [Eimeria tenella]|uniref:Uncharacterized protein n=1 Tax=Eimeria tenella TaxID=5802 RepID=U6KQC4_EIMTE|nr:hypothetical protein ETH_00037105 [Eimeria tenella]CDJ40322.1 hypothetical protein ETH_00037105 [Eimeria tenella]|eukprot:XP_013236348.1 hypothetical protein ETH_00037105 [Eimeria tenella]